MNAENIPLQLASPALLLKRSIKEKRSNCSWASSYQIYCKDILDFSKPDVAFIVKIKKKRFMKAFLGRMYGSRWKCGKTLFAAGLTEGAPILTAERSL